jgi:hypothetical protein
VTIVAFLVVWLALRLVPGVPQSGRLMVVALAGGMLFSLVDAVIGAWRLPVAAMAVAAMVGLIVEGRRVSASEDFVHEAQQVSLAVRVQHLDTIAARSLIRAIVGRSRLRSGSRSIWIGFAWATCGPSALGTRSSCTWCTTSGGPPSAVWWFGCPAPPRRRT